MLEGMLIALVIAAVAQLPWLIWSLFSDRRDWRGGGGQPDEPTPPPIEPIFDWEGFEQQFRSFAGRSDSPSELGRGPASSPAEGPRAEEL